MTTLKSSSDVEEVLKKVETLGFPDRGDDHQFVRMVQEKIASPTLISFSALTLRISFAFVFVSLCFGLWIHKTMMLTPVHTEEKRSHAIPLKGAILEARGNLGGEGAASIYGGDKITTGADSSMTFYFPAGGYVYVGSDSSMAIERAEEEWPSGRVIYELNLEKGTMYLRLDDLEGGSEFFTKTPFGTTHVLGTEFMVEAREQVGMNVEVLKGLVEVRSASNGKTFSKVKKGSRALLSPDGAGTISISELEPGKFSELTDKFNSIFLSAETHVEQKQNQNEPNFRIVLQKEG